MALPRELETRVKGQNERGRVRLRSRERNLRTDRKQTDRGGRDGQGSQADTQWQSAELEALGLIISANKQTKNLKKSTGREERSGRWYPAKFIE